MELRAAITRRRMVRSFADVPLDRHRLDDLLDLARRAPSAGNTQAVGFVVLSGEESVARYWDITLPAGSPGEQSGDRRAKFRWQGLLAAPALVIVTVDPDAYPSRYAEADKKSTGLGAGTDAWPIPYWWVDAGAVAQNLLLLCVDAGLGACLFGPFDHEPALRTAFDLPEQVRLVATIAIGQPSPDEAGTGQGRSAQRPRPSLADITVRP